MHTTKKYSKKWICAPTIPVRMHVNSIKTNFEKSARIYIDHFSLNETIACMLDSKMNISRYVDVSCFEQTNKSSLF